jgi:hypothetical protein
MTMHCTSNLLVNKKKKTNPIIRKGKILILFIILGAKPTSTLGPKRNQLVFKKFIGSLCPILINLIIVGYLSWFSKKTSCEILFIFNKKNSQNQRHWEIAPSALQGYTLC